MDIIITAFYHFIDLPKYEGLKAPLLNFCKKQDLKGTILLAREGLNSTISGSREGIDALYVYLRDEIGIKNLIYKESFLDSKPFKRMKVRLKKEIVAMGQPDIMGRDVKPGTYIKSEDWDEFISRDDVINIDTRNDYEILLGSFKGAIDPKTESFRDFPAWFDEHAHQFEGKKVAMFCTGGIRCEKSTAYVKKKGFDAYHLEGGILKYFEDTEGKSWDGSCFIFDDRVAVNKNLTPATDILCSMCNNEMSTDDIRETAEEGYIACIACRGADPNMSRYKRNEHR